MKINHNLVLTSDLDKMSNFWVDAIGLTMGNRPPFPFKGIWLYSEGQALIHIAEHSNINPDTGVLAHIALEGGDYESLISQLKKLPYYYNEKDVPLSGERQVFIAGPDGLVVEMVFPMNKTSNVAHPY